MTMIPTVRFEPDGKVRRALNERLAAALPDWFGLPATNLAYAEEAEMSPGLIASIDATDVGLIVLQPRGAGDSEIHWLGVHPVHHRRGIGAALIDAAVERLRAEGARRMVVATLHPDDPYEPYRRTRAFYEAQGFKFERALNGPGDRLALYALTL